MILPKDVKTRKRLRDAAILNEWLSGATQESLVSKYGITQQAISSIVRKNREIIKIDKEFEKINRIHYLKQALVNSKPSKKDRLDILEALRNECEGERGFTEVKQIVQVFLPGQNEPVQIEPEPNLSVQKDRLELPADAS